MNNQTTNIIIAVVSLIIIIVFIVKLVLDYLKYKKLSENTVFPPWPATCPDYWKTGSDNSCENIHNIGQCSTGDDKIMKFDDEPIFKGSKGPFYKCNWAKKCETPWEGIDTLC